ncbi:hypothetical protein Strvi_2988 [Streptomyces violaceusniger Tu 4113]|uniref:Uncharacterized protein n=1 Tax=Streptomyces violaceusniger (strain Tu 4113) TaxID=653045 RepID=G2PDT5_STRV4|nr:hypothetical protein Strvi_2988 [Streptomyces violaceusniger Tu 4113]
MIPTVLMRAHGEAADPARLAVRLLANAYCRAWDYGDVPEGAAPQVLAVRYTLHDGTPEPAPASRHTSYPHVREIPAAP